MKKILLLLACLLTLKVQAWDQQLADAKEVAKEAGFLILEVRNSGDLRAEDVDLANGKKIRQTHADVVASEYITQRFLHKYPQYGVISQDQMSKDPDWYTKEYVWIINPIDGTKEFEKGGDDFHVQIGLLKGDEVVVGVSYYPAKNMFITAIKDQGVWREKDGVATQLTLKPCFGDVLIKSSGHDFIKSRLHQIDFKPTKVLDEHLSSTSRLLKIMDGQASLYISLGSSPKGTAKKGGIWNYCANVLFAKETKLILRTLSGKDLDLRSEDGLLKEGVVVTNGEGGSYVQVLQANWGL